MKKFKIGIALFMMVILVFSIGFTGCSQNNESTSGTTAVTTDTSSNETTQAKDEKPVNVIWYMAKDPMPPTADVEMVLAELNKKLIEKINVTLDLRIFDWGNITDRMRMISAANQDYDLVFTASWANQFDQNMARGAFAELDELIDTNAPGLRTAVPKGIMDVARVKGKLYAVPNIQAMFSAWGVYVQKSLLDKYSFDLDSVKTLEDLYPFLENIKNSEPGLIPIKSGLPVQYLDNSCDELNGYAGVKTDDPAFTVFSLHETYGKKGLDASRELFEKGYLRKDSYTIGSDQTADEQANKFAVIPGTCKPGGDLEQSTRRGMEYKMKVLQQPYLKPTAGNDTMTAMNVNSKNKEHAIRLLELIHTDKDIFNTLLYGIQDVNYKKISDNQVEVIEGSKYDLYTAAWSLGNQFNSWYRQGQTVGLWDETAQMNNSAKVSPVRGFTFDSTPIADASAKVDAVREEFRNIEFLPDYDKKLEAYTEKMKAAGLEDIVKETQKQLDEWLKVNGKK